MGAPSGSDLRETLSGRSRLRVTINHAGGFGDLVDQSLLRDRNRVGDEVLLQT
jgi:hypothetical protein